MSLVGPLLREMSYIFGRLVDDHTLDLFGMEVTTRQHATKRAHEAFQHGVAMGASGTVTPADLARLENRKAARVLELVR